MKSRATSGFWRLHDALPERVQERAARAYKAWCDDPAHPSLQFKRVGKSAPVYSVRVGKHYRVVGTLCNDTVTWYWIGSHADYDALLARRSGFSEEPAAYQVLATAAVEPTSNAT